jgi:hypothetical protein
VAECRRAGNLAPDCPQGAIADRSERLLRWEMASCYLSRGAEVRDLELYLRARAERDSEFAAAVESGYQDFRDDALPRQKRDVAGLMPEDVAECADEASDDAESTHGQVSHE